MDVLRNRQYAEILNYDKNINKEVMKRTRQQINKYNEDVLQQQSGNSEAILNFNKLIENLNSAFQQKLTLFDVSTSVSFNDKRYFDLVSMSNIISLYNDVVRFINNPENDNTNQNIYKSNLMSLEEVVAQVYQNYITLFNKATEKADTAVEKARYLNSSLSCRAIMDLIFQQFYNNKFSIINYNDIMTNYNKIFNTINQTTKDFINKHFSTTGEKRKPMLDKIMKDFETEAGRQISKEEKFFLFNDNVNTFDKKILLNLDEPDYKSNPFNFTVNEGINKNDLRNFIQEKINEVPELLKMPDIFKQAEPINLTNTIYSKKVKINWFLNSILDKMKKNFNKITRDAYQKYLRNFFKKSTENLENLKLDSENSNADFIQQYQKTILPLGEELTKILEHLLRIVISVPQDTPPEDTPPEDIEDIEDIEDMPPLEDIPQPEEKSQEEKLNSLKAHLKQIGSLNLDSLYKIFNYEPPREGDALIEKMDKFLIRLIDMVKSYKDESYTDNFRNIMNKIANKYSTYIGLIEVESTSISRKKKLNTNNLTPLLTDLLHQYNLIIDMAEETTPGASSSSSGQGRGGKKPRKQYVKKLMIKPSIEPVVPFNDEENDPFLVTFR